MTVGISTANLANKWLDLLGGTAFTAVTTYIQLHTADPGASGTTGVSGGDANRKTVTWAAAASGSKSMSSMSGSWTEDGTPANETLTHISGWDAATSGNFLFSAALTSSQYWATGNTFSLTSLTISLSPLAA